MSATPRIECPHCRQSIKRPPLAPGEKCLCPKCNQPFTIGASGEPEGVTSKPAAPAPSPPHAPPPQVTKPAAAASKASTSSTPAAPGTAPPKPEVPQPAPTGKPAAAAKPRPAEFALHCFLCGTLLHARVDQVGQKITCHDCHAENEVRAPKPQDLRAAQGPTLDNAEDFRMSEVVERPKFSPIERPRRNEDDAEEDQFQLKPLPVMPTQPVVEPSGGKASNADAGMIDLFSQHGGAPPPAAPTAIPVAPTQSVPPPAVPHPAQFRPPPTTASNTAKPTPSPKIRQHADSYGDELWNGATDPSRPAFERSPFLIGIIEFLFYPETLVRWLTLAALASVPIGIIQMATSATGDEYYSVFSAGVMTLLLFATVAGVPWLAVFGAHAMSIVEDTGRGCDAVEHWPIGGIFPRGNPLYLAIAAAVGSLPGGLLWALYYLPQEGLTIRMALMMLVSAMVFMPLVWLPMLLEKSLQGPLHSLTFWHSFQASGQGWITFYFETLILSLVAYGGMSLWSAGSVVVAPLSAAILVIPLFLYFRLLGRMLWYIDPAMAPPPPAPKPGPAPLPETVDPMLMKPGR